MTKPRDAAPKATAFTHRTVDELEIEDERSFRHVALYSQLKGILKDAKYPFRVLPKPSADRRDRALFLNLTFWNAESGGDVLVDETLPADVVAHVAWHYLASKHLASPGANGANGANGAKPSPATLFLGESIASAFDVYLVGRLLGHAPESSFLETQVPAMFDSAEIAGMSGAAFETWLQGIADDPERAFEELRALLFDAMTKLYACTSAEEALVVLESFSSHRFGCILHHYELSNWVLYARAYAAKGEGDARALEVDAHLRDAKDSLDWLTTAWVEAEVEAER